MTNSSPASPPQIRRLDVQRDLIAAADLIERCFGQQMDPDGHTYLRNIRRAARNNDHLRWMPGPGEQATYPLFGYVWEEDHKLIGNISLIPILHGGTWRYLIANVAVHPDYRGRGIAHLLTRRALQHVRQQQVKLACLQVRDIAPVAHHLYLSHGFEECARRTTWVTHPAQPQELTLPDGIQIAARPSQDWAAQSAWLNTLYPAEVNWNLLYHPRHLAPGIWQRFLNLAGAVQVRQWSAYRGDRLVGVISWEPSPLYADNLWLAVAPENPDPAVVLALLRAARTALNRGRPLSVNFPAGLFNEAFEQAGFHVQNTLIWMEKRF